MPGTKKLPSHPHFPFFASGGSPRGLPAGQRAAPLGTPICTALIVLFRQAYTQVIYLPISSKCNLKDPNLARHEKITAARTVKGFFRSADRHFNATGCSFNATGCSFNVSGRHTAAAGCSFNAPGSHTEATGCSFNASGSHTAATGCSFDVSGYHTAVTGCLFNVSGCHTAVTGLGTVFF